MELKHIPLIPSLALFSLSVFWIYRYLLYPLLVSPLSRIPSAHWTAPFSSLWILRHRHDQNDTLAVHAAHVRLGPIVRIAPNEISVNSVDGGIRSVYSAGFEKGDWYPNVFSNYGVQPMFAMPSHGRHSRRKRMVSHVYAKSVLLGSESMACVTRVVARDRLRDRIRRDVDASGGSGVVEFYTVFAAVTMDLVAGYVFGLKNGSDALRDQERSKTFLLEYKARQAYTFWPQECPVLVRVMAAMRLRWMLVPKWVDEANASIESWIMAMCTRAEESLGEIEARAGSNSATSTSVPEDFPSVYSQLCETLRKEKTDSATAKPRDLLRTEVASELLDHTLAGFDTSSITLTYLAWEISRPQSKQWQTALRQELRGRAQDVRADFKALDALPVLHALIMETLRLHAAIPGQQPRQTPRHPSTPTILGGYVIPGDVRVQAQAWSLHRQASVFPEPEKFDPGRWLDVSPEQSKEMGRWFWAFSSGGRMCVGSNLAMLNMKSTVSSIWEVYETDVVGDGRAAERAMAHNGGYIAGPLGDGQGGYCRLRVKEITDRT